MLSYFPKKYTCNQSLTKDSEDTNAITEYLI